MLAVRNLFRANQQIVKNAAQPARNMSVIAIPPRNKVSQGEIVFLGIGMVLGWSVIPAWVVLNIKHYRGDK